MAHIQVTYMSQALWRSVPVQVILPADKATREGQLLPERKFKTLYLLHGLHVAVDELVHIERAIGNLLIELLHLLVAHLTDDAHHRGLIVVDLTILELALYGFTSKGSLTRLNLIEALAYLVASLRGSNDIEPTLLGSLCA